MRIDIFTPPPALEFGTGESAFKLRLKRFTDAERMALLDACAERSFEQIQVAATRLVEGWENVCDVQGQPIVFAQEDEKTRRCNLPAFLGAVPLAQQIQVLCGIAAFAGIPTGTLEPLALAFGVEIDVRPTRAQPGSTPATASGG